MRPARVTNTSNNQVTVIAIFGLDVKYPFSFPLLSLFSFSFWVLHYEEVAYHKSRKCMITVSLICLFLPFLYFIVFDSISASISIFPNHQKQNRLLARIFCPAERHITPLDLRFETKLSFQIVSPFFLYSSYSSHFYIFHTYLIQSIHARSIAAGARLRRKIP